MSLNLCKKKAQCEPSLSYSEIKGVFPNYYLHICGRLIAHYDPAAESIEMAVHARLSPFICIPKSYIWIGRGTHARPFPRAILQATSGRTCVMRWENLFNFASENEQILTIGSLMEYTWFLRPLLSLLNNSLHPLIRKKRRDRKRQKPKKWSCTHRSHPSRRWMPPSPHWSTASKNPWSKDFFVFNQCDCTLFRPHDLCRWCP